VPVGFGRSTAGFEGGAAGLDGGCALPIAGSVSAHINPAVTANRFMLHSS
jgi:glycerol uptake facilitator-like aquaporin